MSAVASPAAPIGPARSRRASVKRALAIMLLPASIIPVFFLGPSLLRAPRHLWRMTYADVHRIIWPVEHRRFIPPEIAPVEGPNDTPALRRGGTVTLPAAKRTPR
jgi:hypothetical protein